MSNQSDNLTRLGVDAPSGDLVRDLKDGKRVLLRRGTHCTVVREAPDLGERTLRFIASTDGIKRDGNRVRNDAGSWDFGNFSKNPVMLWTHDYGSADRPPMPPIGSWVDWTVERDTNGNSSLVMSGRFATHEFADLVYNLYLEGHMRAVSIGWTPLEFEEILQDGKFIGWDFKRNELLECSAVPIPADPDAIMVAAQRGLIPERALSHFTNWMSPSRGIAYVLDSRERPEAAGPIRTASASVDFAAFWAEVAVAAEQIARTQTGRAEGDVSVTCPACGAAAPENANYCPMCGAALVEPDGTTTTETPAEGDHGTVSRDTDPAEILTIVHRARGASDDMWDQVARMCDMAERCYGPTRAEGVEVEVEVGTDGEAEGGVTGDPADDPMLAATTAAESVMELAAQIVSATQMIYDTLVGDTQEDATEGETAPAAGEESAPETASLKGRVGKKIAKSRMKRLEEAHATIRSGAKYLREILDEVAKEDMDGTASGEADQLREKIGDLIRRKETLVLRKRLESAIERKDRLRAYAETLLPGKRPE